MTDFHKSLDAAIERTSGHSVEKDAVERAIARVESHPVRNAQTRVVTGYMVPVAEWREIRAALRQTYVTSPDGGRA